jgi:D-lyxose ketol-isomerase
MIERTTGWTPHLLGPIIVGGAKRDYQAMYRHAFPSAGALPFDKIEVASFGLSSTRREFDQIGLGLWTTEINPGLYTQKILMNFPGQLLPAHSHRTVLVTTKAFEPEYLAKGFVLVHDNVNGFQGIYDYNPDGSIKTETEGPVFRYADSQYAIFHPSTKGWIDPGNAIVIIPGKQETFRPVAGNGILFCNRDEVTVLVEPEQKDLRRQFFIDSLWEVPMEIESQVEAVKRLTPIAAKDTLFLTGGVIVRLLEDATHAFLAGPRGAVYEETSMPSLDCADVFADPRILR